MNWMRSLQIFVKKRLSKLGVSEENIHQGDALKDDCLTPRFFEKKSEKITTSEIYFGKSN